MQLTLNTLPVYYINRDSETEKAETLETWLRQKGFTKITRWPGVEDTRPAMGCARAHNGLLAHLATHHNKKDQLPVLVLEDDVQPWAWKHQIHIPDDTDAYYLGLSEYGLYNSRGTMKVSVEHVGKETWRIYNMLAAHAIIYFNVEYIQWLHRATLVAVDMQTNQDKARAQTLKYWKVYGPRRALVYQNGKHRLRTKVQLPTKGTVDKRGAF